MSEPQLGVLPQLGVAPKVLRAVVLILREHKQFFTQHLGVRELSTS